MRGGKLTNHVGNEHGLGGKLVVKSDLPAQAAAIRYHQLIHDEAFIANSLETAAVEQEQIIPKEHLNQMQQMSLFGVMGGQISIETRCSPQMKTDRTQRVLDNSNPLSPNAVSATGEGVVSPDNQDVSPFFNQYATQSPHNVIILPTPGNDFTPFKSSDGLLKEDMVERKSTIRNLMEPRQINSQLSQDMVASNKTLDVLTVIGGSFLPQSMEASKAEMAVIDSKSRQDPKEHPMTFQLDYTADNMTLGNQTNASIEFFQQHSDRAEITPINLVVEKVKKTSNKTSKVTNKKSTPQQQIPQQLAVMNKQILPDLQTQSELKKIVAVGRHAYQSTLTRAQKSPLVNANPFMTNSNNAILTGTGNHPLVASSTGYKKKLVVSNTSLVNKSKVTDAIDPTLPQANQTGGGVQVHKEPSPRKSAEEQSFDLNQASQTKFDDKKSSQHESQKTFANEQNNLQAERSSYAMALKEPQIQSFRVYAELPDGTEKTKKVHHIDAQAQCGIVYRDQFISQTLIGQQSARSISQMHEKSTKSRQAAEFFDENPSTLKHLSPKRSVNPSVLQKRETSNLSPFLTDPVDEIEDEIQASLSPTLINKTRLFKQQIEGRQTKDQQTSSFQIHEQMYNQKDGSILLSPDSSSLLHETPFMERNEVLKAMQELRPIVAKKETNDSIETLVVAPNLLPAQSSSQSRERSFMQLAKVDLMSGADHHVGQSHIKTENYGRVVSKKNQKGSKEKLPKNQLNMTGSIRGEGATLKAEMWNMSKSMQSNQWVKFKKQEAGFGATQGARKKALRATGWQTIKGSPQKEAARTFGKLSEETTSEYISTELNFLSPTIKGVGYATHMPQSPDKQSKVDVNRQTAEQWLNQQSFKLPGKTKETMSNAGEKGEGSIRESIRDAESLKLSTNIGAMTSGFTKDGNMFGKETSSKLLPNTDDQIDEQKRTASEVNETCDIGKGVGRSPANEKSPLRSSSSKSSAVFYYSQKKQVLNSASDPEFATKDQAAGRSSDPNFCNPSRDKQSASDPQANDPSRVTDTDKDNTDKDTLANESKLIMKSNFQHQQSVVKFGSGEILQEGRVDMTSSSPLIKQISTIKTISTLINSPLANKMTTSQRHLVWIKPSKSSLDSTHREGRKSKKNQSSLSKIVIKSHPGSPTIKASTIQVMNQDISEQLEANKSKGKSKIKQASPRSRFAQHNSMIRKKVGFREKDDNSKESPVRKGQDSQLSISGKNQLDSSAESGNSRTSHELKKEPTASKIEPVVLRKYSILSIHSPELEATKSLRHSVMSSTKSINKFIKKSPVIEKSHSPLKQSHGITCQSFVTVKQPSVTSSRPDPSGTTQSRLMPAMFSSTLNSSKFGNFGQYVEYLGSHTIEDGSGRENALSPHLRHFQNSMDAGSRLQSFRNTLIKVKNTDQANGKADQGENGETQLLRVILQAMMKRHEPIDKERPRRGVTQDVYKNRRKVGPKGLIHKVESNLQNAVRVVNSSPNDQLRFEEADVERNLYKEYKLAKILAEGIDQLPQNWQVLSPINRRKAKVNLKKALAKLRQSDDGASQSDEQQNEHSQEAMRVQQKAVPTETKASLFNSLVSSNEFNVESSAGFKGPHSIRSLSKTNKTRGAENFLFQAKSDGQSTDLGVYRTKEYLQSTDSSFLPKIGDKPNVTMTLLNQEKLKQNLSHYEQTLLKFGSQQIAQGKANFQNETIKEGSLQPIYNSRFARIDHNSIESKLQGAFDTQTEVLNSSENELLNSRSILHQKSSAQEILLNKEIALSRKHIAIQSQTFKKEETPGASRILSVLTDRNKQHQIANESESKLPLLGRSLQTDSLWPHSTQQKPYGTTIEEADWKRSPPMVNQQKIEAHNRKVRTKMSKQPVVSLQRDKADSPGKSPQRAAQDLAIRLHENSSNLMNIPQRDVQALTTKNQTNVSRNTSIARRLNQSVDVEQNRLSDLLNQTNRFQDILQFKNQRLTKEKFTRDSNPILIELYEKLKNPTKKNSQLQKSLLLRGPASHVNTTTASTPNTNVRARYLKKQTKGDQVKSVDIRRAIKEEKTIPDVPLHRMDTINRNLAEALLDEVAYDRVPSSVWAKQNVMLPILNTVNKAHELHSSFDLCMDDIQEHVKVYNASNRYRSHRGPKAIQRQQKIVRLNNESQPQLSDLNTSQSPQHNISIANSSIMQSTGGIVSTQDGPSHLQSQLIVMHNTDGKVKEQNESMIVSKHHLASSLLQSKQKLQSSEIKLVDTSRLLSNQSAKPPVDQDDGQAASSIYRTAQARPKIVSGIILRDESFSKAKSSKLKPQQRDYSKPLDGGELLRKNFASKSKNKVKEQSILKRIADDEAREKERIASALDQRDQAEFNLMLDIVAQQAAIDELAKPKELLEADLSKRKSFRKSPGRGRNSSRRNMASSSLRLKSMHL